MISNSLLTNSLTKYGYITYKQIVPTVYHKTMWLKQKQKLNIAMMTGFLLPLFIQNTSTFKISVNTKT